MIVLLSKRHLPKGNKMKSLHGFLAVLLVATIGCSSQPPASVPTGGSSEPYDIKLNEQIGVKLGSTFQEFQKKHPSDAAECIKKDPIGVALCTIPVFHRRLKIGYTKVSDYSLRFYRDRLVWISYSLASYDWEPLKTAMKSKFGPPQQAEHEGPFAPDLTWRNSVSSIHLWVSDNDHTHGHLELELDREISEWLDAFRKFKQAEAKSGL
jgi:hypothetical protein